MNIVQLVLQSGGQAAINQLAQRVGLSENQANQILGMVLPALAQGVKRNLNDSSQLNGFVKALARGGHQKVLEQPEVLVKEETVQDGNAILGHLLGSKEVSRQVAARVADKTGTDQDIVKQLLPMAATLAMGALSKETQKRGVLSEQISSDTKSQTTLMNTFMEFLDMDDDGNVMDDVMNIAQRFF